MQSLTPSSSKPEVLTNKYLAFVSNGIATDMLSKDHMSKVMCKSSSPSTGYNFTTMRVNQNKHGHENEIVCSFDTEIICNNV